MAMLNNQMIYEIHVSWLSSFFSWVACLKNLKIVPPKSIGWSSCPYSLTIDD